MITEQGGRLVREEEEETRLENSAPKTVLGLGNLPGTVSCMDSSSISSHSSPACCVAERNISYSTKETAKWGPGTGGPGFQVWLCHLLAGKLQRSL